MTVASVVELVSARRHPYLTVLSGAHVGELYGLTLPRTIVGRGRNADLRLIDEGVSRSHAEIVVRGQHVSARDLGSLNGTFHNGRRTEFCRLADGDKLTVGAMTVLKFSFQEGVQVEFQRELYASAVRDRVTRALRREFFLERLQAEVAFSLLHSAPLALIFWDLDDFKALNDLYGHPAGDRVLAAVSEAVRRVIPHGHVLGRWGGDELALICGSASPETAYCIAERLRRVVESTRVPLDHETVGVTASFGFAVCPASGISTASDLLRAADAAICRAKAAGKNRTDRPR
jgi:two-component system cell cycle response regulator